MIDRVVIIGLDGAGSFHSTQNTPSIVSFLTSGSYSNFARNEFPTNSGENWGSILTGVLPSKHGVTNENIHNPYSEVSEYPTVFKILHQEFPNNQSASLVSWTPINIGLVEESLPVFKYSKPDAELIEFLTQEFIPGQLKNTNLLFIHLDDIDHAGHTYGWGSPEYEQQLKKTDGQFQKILDAIHNAELDPSTLVVVTADHGGLNKDHGGKSFAESHVLLGFKGPGVLEREFGLDELSVLDIPATVVHALGAKVPANLDGKVIQIFG